MKSYKSYLLCVWQKYFSKIIGEHSSRKKIFAELDQCYAMVSGDTDFNGWNGNVVVEVCVGGGQGL